MKQQIFIDTDVFLDTILARSPHFEHSQHIINLCEQNIIDGNTSSLVMANIYYIIQKLSDRHKAKDAINKISSFINILPFTDKEIKAALHSEFKDFEDAAQYFIAQNHKIDFFITRNIRDFKKTPMALFTPKEFLKTLE